MVGTLDQALIFSRRSINPNSNALPDAIGVLVFAATESFGKGNV